MSNFSSHPFVLDGVRCKTVEAFIQGIKFPSDDPRRDQIFNMDGLPAWKMRIHAKGDYVWWNGDQIIYRSPEHSALIKRAIEAKFAQNPEAMEALTSTKDLVIIHEPGGTKKRKNGDKQKRGQAQLIQNKSGIVIFMARVARVDVGDQVYHVLNRAMGRLQIFNTTEDYKLFLHLLREAKEMTDMRVLSFVVMPNHWHLLLYPRNDGNMALFMH